MQKLIDWFLGLFRKKPDPISQVPETYEILINTDDKLIL